MIRYIVQRLEGLIPDMKAVGRVMQNERLEIHIHSEAFLLHISFSWGQPYSIALLHTDRSCASIKNAV